MPAFHPRAATSTGPNAWLGLICATAVAIATAAGAVRAQQSGPTRLPIERAIASLPALFPGKSYSVWVSAQGDLNGDGIADIAMVLTGSNGSGDREERLAVLAGHADGAYTLLSASGEYCHVRKFYNLEIARNSLYVQGVNSVDADNVASVTLQFRYEPRLGDLQLIGREEDSQSQVKPRRYTVSVNYLTHTMVHARRDGGRQREVKRSDAALVPRPLRGFDCATLDADQPRLYIDKDFSIRE